MNSRGRTLERINSKKKRSNSAPPSKSSSEQYSSQTIRKQKHLPPWDDTVNDLSVYKLSQEEQEKRRLSLQSGNLPLARAELRQKFRDDNESDSESELRRSSKFESAISKEVKDSLTPIIQRQKSQAWNENHKEEQPPSIDFSKIDFSKFLQKLASNIATDAEDNPTVSSRPYSAGKKKKDKKHSKKQSTSTVILDSDLEQKGPTVHHMEDQIRELEQQRMSESFNGRLSGSLPPRPPNQKATVTTTSVRPPIASFQTLPNAPPISQIEQQEIYPKEDMGAFEMKYLRSDSEHYKTVIDNLTSHLIQSELQLKQQKEERTALQSSLAEHKTLIDKLNQRVSNFEQLESSWNSKLDEFSKEISQLKAHQQELQTQKELSVQNQSESSSSCFQHPPQTPAREEYPPRPFTELSSPIDALPMSLEVPVRSPVQNPLQYSPTDGSAPYRVPIPYQRAPYPIRAPVLVQRPMVPGHHPPHVMRIPASNWNPQFPQHQEPVHPPSAPMTSQGQENAHPNQPIPPSRVPVTKSMYSQPEASTQPSYQAPPPQRQPFYAAATAKSITVESKPAEKFSILEVRPQTIPSATGYSKPASQNIVIGQGPPRKAMLSSTAKLRT